MRAVNITSINEKDHNVLCGWRNSPDFLRLCTQQSGPIDLKNFSEELKQCFARGRHWQSMIRDEAGTPLGTIYSYDYSKRNKYCFVTTYVEVGRSTGVGLVATLRFCAALFRAEELYKIYFDVHEYNDAVKDMLERCGLNIEGEFKGHCEFKGTRYDTFRFALYRETLDRLCGRYGAILLRAPTRNSLTGPMEADSPEFPKTSGNW